MSAVEPLTPKQEALFREGLRTAPSLDPADTLPRSFLDYATAEWADRCRRLLATLDACRAAPALPAGLPDVERLAAALRPGHLFEHPGHVEECPQRDGPASLAMAAAILAALEGSATLPSDPHTSVCTVCGTPLPTDEAAIAHLNESLDIERAATLPSDRGLVALVDEANHEGLIAEPSDRGREP